LVLVLVEVLFLTGHQWATGAKTAHANSANESFVFH